MAIGETSYPDAIDTASELLRAVNNARTTIASPGLSSGATTIPVASASQAPPDGLALIATFNLDGTINEHEFVTFTGKTANSLTGVTRGFGDSGDSSWPAGVSIFFDIITAYHHNVLASAIIAIQELLGANGENMGGGGGIERTIGWQVAHDGFIVFFIDSPLEYETTETPYNAINRSGIRYIDLSGTTECRLLLEVGNITNGMNDQDNVTLPGAELWIEWSETWGGTYEPLGPVITGFDTVGVKTSGWVALDPDAIAAGEVFVRVMTDGGPPPIPFEEEFIRLIYMYLTVRS